MKPPRALCLLRDDRRLDVLEPEDVVLRIDRGLDDLEFRRRHPRLRLLELDEGDDALVDAELRILALVTTSAPATIVLSGSVATA